MAQALHHAAITFALWSLLLFFDNGASAGVLRHLEHACSHTVRHLHDDVFYNVHVGPEHEIKKRSLDQPLRIHVHFDGSLDHLPLEHQNLVKSHVETAVTFWESTLKVRATSHPIRLRRKCLTDQVKFRDRTAYCMHGCQDITVCGDITIPNNHLEGCMYYNQTSGQYVHENTTSFGVAIADFILYIATISSKKCREGQTIAYAAHCQQEQALDRPVAGYFSICPNSISSSKQNQLQLLSTMKHEILHALGFTAGLFAFYRDDNGEPLSLRNPVTGRPDFKKDMYQWSTAVVRQVVRTGWLQKTGVTNKTVHMMVTPRVKDEVRKHFGCPTLEGAELEDQGIDGTVLTHWEKRVFENEAMTGTHTQNSIISRITLAMMEDTGWYKSDYSQAGDYEWGRDLGCEFVQNSCYHWIRTRMARRESIHPFCDQVKRGELWTECAHSRKSVALCNLVEHNNVLPAKYQYFDSLPGVSKDDIGRYAGSVALADHCPYLQEFSWTNDNNVSVRGSNCEDHENNLDPANNFFGENYSESSLCFEHASKWFLHQGSSTKSPQHAGSGCYEYNCSAALGLHIKVQGQLYRCCTENQVLKVRFRSASYIHQGTIVCPSCEDICKNKGVVCPHISDSQDQGKSVCGGCISISQKFLAIFLMSLLCFSLSR